MLLIIDMALRFIPILSIKQINEKIEILFFINVEDS